MGAEPSCGDARAAGSTGALLPPALRCELCLEAVQWTVLASAQAEAAAAALAAEAGSSAGRRRCAMRAYSPCAATCPGMFKLIGCGNSGVFLIPTVSASMTKLTTFGASQS